MLMSNIPNVINDEALQGDDSQDPADHFLLREDQFMSDTEADADALASAGMGTDEDYGYFGGGED